MTQITQEQKNQFSAALERVAGDEEMLVMLAEIVAEDAPPMLQKLEHQLQAGELHASSQTAHALKGLLSTFETRAPVDRLQPLIDAGRANESETSKELFVSIKGSLESLIVQIEQLTP